MHFSQLSGMVQKEKRGVSIMKKFLFVLVCVIVLGFIFLPTRAGVPEYQGPCHAYEQEEERRLCAAQALHLPPDATWEEMAEHGRPIVAQSLDLDEDATWEEITAVIRAAKNEAEPT